MKYRFCGLELDVGARTLEVDGVHVHVEPQVFDLIVYLVENRGRVVDKDELLARVWKGRVVSDATIATRINAARRVLRDDGRRQHIIATLPRRGFRFAAEVGVNGETQGRPTVAVTPLSLLSDDRSNGYLARGLADQLAATLGQAGWFDIRDTAASFASSLEGAGPAEMARKLKADYLVTGSLQTNGDVLRLFVRLIDPRNDHQVWSATFSGGHGDLFAMQDRMAGQVLGELEPRLRRIELLRSAERHGSLSAFDHYLRAADALRAMSLSAMHAACVDLDKAVLAHPAYAAAHGMRAWIATLMLPHGRRVDAVRERERARFAVSEGSFDCDALSMGGYALGFFDRDPATGLGYVRRALALNPSSARSHDFAGWLLLYGGGSGEALAHFDRALSLCPIDEFGFRMLTGRAFAHLYQHDFEAAVLDARRAHAAAPSYTVCHRVLIAALAHLGRRAEARATLRDLLSIRPGLTLARFAKETRFDDPADREVLFGGLKQAGLT
ncbi:winged helix-turn-helix domain-containing protein [Oricola cellulosilytica]|uniref:OmpR/PhoB-type domain-containing protein n=1 Tax=Oricola cellulosilytica TaxID=1429082 RepID=A0A4R0P9H0_9HYPH|nr:winged helix-turn-helix domain-containing protein [Oricola cellulosilytica]TCD13820.1 hypothetical protein E0D97_12020 [Oricola cellulosilytica]